MDGYLLVDKPKAISSFGVVAKVRGILRKEMLSASRLDALQGSKEERAISTDGTWSERQTIADTAMRQKPGGMTGYAGQQGKASRRLKVGHTGTLDPAAEGLMILVLGAYTKRAGEFSKMDKVYEVEATLGAVSSTGDIEGQITKKSQKIPTLEEVQAVLDSLTGQIMQLPPIYSAIKVGGKRAYHLAREGKEVVLQPREVNIHSISNIEYKYPKLSFNAHVGSGTYIRSLVEDIGTKLGTGAYMTALRRTKVGDYNLEQAISAENLNYQQLLRSLRK